MHFNAFHGISWHFSVAAAMASSNLAGWKRRSQAKGREPRGFVDAAAPVPQGELRRNVNEFQRISKHKRKKIRLILKM